MANQLGGAVGMLLTQVVQVYSVSFRSHTVALRCKSTQSQANKHGLKASKVHAYNQCFLTFPSLGALRTCTDYDDTTPCVRPSRYTSKTWAIATCTWTSSCMCKPAAPLTMVWVVISLALPHLSRPGIWAGHGAWPPLTPGGLGSATA